MLEKRLRSRGFVGVCVASVFANHASASTDAMTDTVLIAVLEPTKLVSQLVTEVTKMLLLHKLGMGTLTVVGAVLAAVGVAMAVGPLFGRADPLAENPPNVSTGSRSEPALTNKEPRANRELAGLEGQWDLVSEARDGVKSELMFKSYRFTFKEKEVTTRWERIDGRSGGGTNEYVIDTTKMPKELTITGDNLRIQAVYKLNKDELTIATFGKPEDVRPRGFTAADSGGDQEILVVRILKRAPGPEGKPVAHADRSWRDRSNTEFLLEALKAASTPQDDTATKKAKIGELPKERVDEPKQAPEILNPPSVTTGKRYAYIEGELDEKTELVLRVGEEKDKMIWNLRSKENGAFEGGVYPSDKIKLKDGTFGAGIVLGINSKNSTGYVIPPSVSIPLPSGELIFREEKKIVWKEGVVTFADLKQDDGKMTPVSIFIRTRK